MLDIQEFCNDCGGFCYSSFTFVMLHLGVLRRGDRGYIVSYPHVEGIKVPIPCSVAL